MKYADLVLTRDQILGASVFIDSLRGGEHQAEETPRYEQIGDFLRQYPKANQVFLEFLVSEKKVQVRLQDLQKG